MKPISLFRHIIGGVDLTYLHDYLSLLCVLSFEKTFQPLSCFRSFSGSSPAESEDTSTVRPCVDFKKEDMQPVVSCPPAGSE